MKPSDKLLMRVAAVCVAAGLLLAAVALAIGGFRSQGFSDGQAYEKTEYEFDGGRVNRLTVQAKECDVVLAASPDSRFYVTAYENDRLFFDIEITKTGELLVKQLNNKKWYDYIQVNFDFLNPQEDALTIAVPKDFAGAVDVDSDCGAVTLDGLAVNDDLTVNSALGAIKATEVAAGGDIALSTDNGTIKLKTVTGARDIAVRSSLGELDLDSVTSAGGASLRASSGSIRINGAAIGGDLDVDSALGSFTAEKLSVAGTLAAKLDSGTAKLSDVDVTGDVTLESGLGEIGFDMLRCNNLSIDSDSGAVRGVLDAAPSDYTVQARAELGSVDIPIAVGGTKLLKVDCALGDIKISFSKE